MATIITEECINCGACEPECPNTAIYQGGVEYDWQGKKHPGLSADFFYIVPEKCTECVGFFDHEACAAVCPVDCCVPDPNLPESEQALLQRARELHPDKDFPSDAPSRFRKADGAAAEVAASATAAAIKPGAQPVPPAQSGEQAAAAPTSAPSSTAAAAGKAAPAAAASRAASGNGAPVSAAAGIASAGARVEMPLLKPRRVLGAGDPARDSLGELDVPFEDTLRRVRQAKGRGGSRVTGLALLAASPLLGALDHEAKRTIERAYNDTGFFSAQLATALNIGVDFLLYPIGFFVLGLLDGMQAFTQADKSWIVVGVLVAAMETLLRLRDGIIHAKPADEIRYGPSFYGMLLSPVFRAVVSRFGGGRRSGWIPVEGFYSADFEPKREREKRYGEVYTLEEFDSGYYLRMEMPRRIPDSAAKTELEFGDDMPDYDLRVAVDHGTLTVRGSVVDPELRAVCGVSPAFPADFKTDIPLQGPLAGFRHRYADKLLEIAVLKAGT